MTLPIDRAALPATFSLSYTSPDGQTHQMRAAWTRGELAFVFQDIAEALLYDDAQRMVPTCLKSDVRRVQFKDTRHARKCVTSDGLFTCTPRSRTDDFTEAASGPAIHLHAWLRAVMIPLLELDHFPPTEDEALDYQCRYLARERERISRTLDALIEQRLAAQMPAEPEAAKPAEYDPFSADELNAALKV